MIVKDQVSKSLLEEVTLPDTGSSKNGVVVWCFSIQVQQDYSSQEGATKLETTDNVSQMRSTDIRDE